MFSNAKNHRRDPLVPLVVPTVNVDHLGLIPHQRRQHGLARGLLVCNSNCAVIGLVIPLAALQRALGAVEAASVVTLQAVSGAGYPGASAMDVLDNVVPYIAGEEDKVETEAQKILGRLAADATALEDLTAMRVSAACNRVPVLDGHVACVSLRFAARPPPTAAQCAAALRALRVRRPAPRLPQRPRPRHRRLRRARPPAAAPRPRPGRRLHRQRRPRARGPDGRLRHQVCRAEPQQCVFPAVPCLSGSYLTCAYLTCSYLTCPYLTCPYFTCPCLTCPCLSCPYITCPCLSCP